MKTPYIDPNVRYVGVSKLRELNAENLRNLADTLVVQDAASTPLVVVVKFETYLRMQERIELADERGSA